ncbi:response regulator [Alloalcanivorax marinus]|uniref:response regulator n=1 Tax=Alloalcanivorax marinus TaxID=1177169 RepID=UPI0021D3CE28|nr:response regulator [Alloalcanivorax marinus]MCU5787222.1 response regulator receiver protein [Alloalcanivorax marinus]
MNDKPTVLLVDDEERVLRSLSLLFRPHFQVLTTTNGYEAERLVRERRVHVIVSDQRMPIMEGIEVLRRVRRASPHTQRLLLTGYADLQAVIDSINDGEVFRYLNKPWQMHEMLHAVRRAADIALSLEATEAAPEVEPAAVTPVGDEPEPAVLVLDEDPETLALLRTVVAPGQALHHRTDLDQAFALLADQEDIGILVCDVRLGGADISAAIQALKRAHPALLTILVSPVRDVEILGRLINRGQIYRFLPKPVRRAMLKMSLEAAARRHRLLRHHPEARAASAPDPAPERDPGLSRRLFGYLERLRQRGGVS